MSKNTYRPPHFNRDHARPRNVPAPTTEAMEARLTELISQKTVGLMAQYHDLGLRWRILNLPVMVALLLTMVWRQVPSVTALVEMLSRESLLWVVPRRVTQQALSERLKSLPSELFEAVFHSVLPELMAASRGRSRPQPRVIALARLHFSQIWVVDASTLSEVFRKIDTLRGTTTPVLGGKMMAVLDLVSKLPIKIWLDENSHANDRSFFDRIKPLIRAGTLVIFDRGFNSFAFFDHLSESGAYFITRLCSGTAFSVQQVLLETERVRDRVICVGRYRSNPSKFPLRLVEIYIDGGWRSYLTNVLDPTILSPGDVFDLYGRRWRIEDAFLITKRLLGLSYLWTGAFNGIAMQVWTTWLLHAVLIDLCDAVANELGMPLDQISVEKVYRGLYFFVGAYERHEASDPISYLAAQTDLGIVKRRRKYRERARQNRMPVELNL